MISILRCTDPASSLASAVLKEKTSGREVPEGVQWGPSCGMERGGYLAGTTDYWDGICLPFVFHARIVDNGCLFSAVLSYVPLSFVCICTFPFMVVLLASHGDRGDRGCTHRARLGHACPLAMVIFAAGYSVSVLS